MQLSALTSEQLIVLDETFENPMAAINQLADRLDAAGKLADKKAFLDAVMKREKEGPTALGEGLAVPHGKSDGVKEAAFACARVKGDLLWEGLDGDEEIELVFLLAIPTAEAGTTHMGILTELTSSLVDDDFREALLEAKDTATVMKLFGDEESTEQETPAAPAQAPVISDNPAASDNTSRSSNRAYTMVILAGVVACFGLFALM